jgi:hypothetical protein
MAKTAKFTSQTATINWSLFAIAIGLILLWAGYAQYSAANEPASPSAAAYLSPLLFAAGASFFMIAFRLAVIASWPRSSTRLVTSSITLCITIGAAVWYDLITRSLVGPIPDAANWGIALASLIVLLFGYVPVLVVSLLFFIADLIMPALRSGHAAQALRAQGQHVGADGKLRR